MISELAQRLLDLFKAQPDPISRAELADMLDSTEHEILKALGELKEVHPIEKLNSGYRLEPANTKIDSNDSQMVQLLTMLAGSTTRLFPRSIVTKLGLSSTQVKKLLNELQENGIVDVRTPGTYYFTTTGIEKIRTQYPDITIPVFVEAKAKTDVSDFSVNPTFNPGKKKNNKQHPEPDGTLTNVPEKISLLNSISQRYKGAPLQELKELICFLQKSQEAAA